MPELKRGGMPELKVILDQIMLGIVLVNEDCSVRFINRPALGITEKNDGLRYFRNELSANHPDERIKLKDSVRDVINIAKEDRIEMCCSLTVSRESSNCPYILLIKNHFDLDMAPSFEPCAMVLITDPSRPFEASERYLHKLFDLTLAESKLVKLILADRSVKEAADELGIAPNTARKHLMAIFNKTGTKRQAQLVRLIMSTPLWALSDHCCCADNVFSLKSEAK